MGGGLAIAHAGDVSDEFYFISMNKLNIFGNKKVADYLCVSLHFRNFAHT
jgi:hypothetical protein